METGYKDELLAVDARPNPGSGNEGTFSSTGIGSLLLIFLPAFLAEGLASGGSRTSSLFPPIRFPTDPSCSYGSWYFVGLRGMKFMIGSDSKETPSRRPESMRAGRGFEGGGK